MGFLAIAGELANILPPNEKLLQEIAQTAKNAYYSQENQTAQEALEKTLERINNFLGALRKKGNVSWLGNLHLAIFAISGEEFYFSKTGSIKLFLARGGELLDIGKNLETSQTIHPMRSFSHLATGRVAPKDLILCITKDIFHFFEATGILGQLVFLEEKDEEKSIKKILGQHEKQLKEYPGLLLTVRVEQQEGRPLLPHKIPLSISFPKIHMPGLTGKQKKTAVQSKISALPRRIAQIKSSVAKASLGRPKVSFRHPKIGFPFTISLAALSGTKTKENFLLMITFIIVVLGGFAVAQFQKRIAATAAEEKLLEAQQKIWDAESKLIANQQKEGNLLFQEALVDLKALSDSPVKKRAEKLQEELQERLLQVNKIKLISAQPLFTVPGEAQILLRLGDTFYFANPKFQEIQSWNSTKNEKEILQIPWSFDLVKEFQNVLLFYDSKGQRLIVGDGLEVKLFPPHLGFSAADFSSFRQALYFLDAAAGTIVKYNFLPNQEELVPQVWTNSSSDLRLRNALSLAIDGSLWILDKNGAIHRYWGGSWHGTLDTTLWPKLSKPTKIFTLNRLPHLYILDPPEKRIVILDKQGNIVKQYRSERFDNLKDFSVSDDGKTIYLLNGRELYQIPVE